MRYIVTKDGKFFDIKRIKLQLKSDGYYKKYKFEKLTVNKTLQEIQLNWTCYDGNNNLCHFGIRLNCDSIEYKQANTIEELTDVYVIVPKDQKSKPYTVNTLSVFDDIEDVLKHNDIYSSIWVNALLKPVAKMNDKGVLEYYEN